MSSQNSVSQQTPSKKSKKSKTSKSDTSAKKRKRSVALEEDLEVADAPQSSPSKKSRHTQPSGHATSPAEARRIEDTKILLKSDTPFFTQTTSFYLALSPIGQRNPLEGLCAEHLSPLILTYYTPLRGVVLSYANPRLSEKPPPTASQERILSRATDEYAVTYCWLTADFTVLRPARGAWIQGHVTVQSPSHVGLVCWNLFSASIDKRHLPRGWRWSARGKPSGTGQRAGSAMPGQQDDVEGYFLDENGEKVEGMVKFRIRDFDVTTEMGKEKGFTSIEGTMLDEKEEKKVEAEAGLGFGRNVSRRLPGSVSAAA